MRKFLLPIIVVIAAVLYSSVVVVTEGTRGIMLRFNKVQRDAENKVVVYLICLVFLTVYHFLHNKIQVHDRKNNLRGLWESLIGFLLSLSQAVQLQLIFS